MRRPPRTPLPLLVALGLVLAAGADAQESLPATPAATPLVWRSEPTLPSGAAVSHAPRERFFLAEAFGGPNEELAAGLALRPPPVSRATLEGSVEGMNRYHAVPGGIVLGLVAEPTGFDAGALDGARLAGSIEDGIGLALADGRLLRAPALEASTLRACLEFAAQGLDGVVDLTADPRQPPRVAPAFVAAGLTARLAELDALPHRLRPETCAYKTLIVDRAVGFRAAGQALVLTADLEVRLYDDAQGWLERAGSVAAAGSALFGPRTAGDLGVELAPLAELAGWIAFVRWARAHDPLGFAALLGHAGH